MKQILLFFLVLLPVCAFAQFKETFEGTEIPAYWKAGGTSSIDSFAIDSEGRLGLNIRPTGQGKCSIGTNIPYSSDMQWEFDVYMRKAPSDQNMLRIYLYQGEGSDEYYYIQIGYSGSKKLGLQKAGKIEMFDRKENNYSDAPLLLHIKVTLENQEKWTVYSSQNESLYYKEEGTCICPILHACNNGTLLFYFIYTKTLSNLFSIDNIQVSSIITPTLLEPDEITLLSCVEDGDTAVQLTFDRKIEAEKSVFLQNNIESEKVYISDDDKILMPVWARKREKGQNYTLVYSGIFDQENNVQECKGSYTFISQQGNTNENEDQKDNEDQADEDQEPSSSYSPGSLLINEVMADPKGLTALPETEYVELYNASTSPIQLENWSFLYGGKATTLDELLLPVGKYLVLYREGRDIAVDQGGFKMPLAKFPSALANTGKDLELKDPSGTSIDAFTYEKARPGLSWERTGGHWHLSSDSRGGTPGSVNTVKASESDPEEPKDPILPDNPEKPSEPDTPKEPDKPQPPVIPEGPTIEPGEIIFNELLPNPFTDGSEYIELYNRSERQLYLSGLSIATRKTDGSLSTHYPLSSISSVLEAGGYILLTKSIEGVTPFYLISSPDALHELKLPVLANASSTLVLFRTKDKIIIDEVSYSSKWHATSIKNEKGVSLERIHPDGITQDASNWTSASETAGFGTPGYRNSQKEHIEKPDDATGIEPPVYIEPTGSYMIPYLLDGSGYNCRIWIYNTVGRCVAEIANHELLGTFGELQWNGVGTNGKKLNSGPYIFYAELYHISGSVKRYKKVFLVR